MKKAYREMIHWSPLNAPNLTLCAFSLSGRHELFPVNGRPCQKWRDNRRKKLPVHQARTHHLVKVEHNWIITRERKMSEWLHKRDTFNWTCELEWTFELQIRLQKNNTSVGWQIIERERERERGRDIYTLSGVKWLLLRVAVLLMAAVVLIAGHFLPHSL